MSCPICETRFTCTIMCSTQEEPSKTQVFIFIILYKIIHTVSVVLEVVFLVS